MATETRFTPLVAVVSFNHLRGPELEHWFGVEDGSDPTTENGWELIPYMALPDGAHQSEEEFSYFSLVYKGHSGSDVEATSVFGISCMQQIPADSLLWKGPDVTRSSVQKAVVAIIDQPERFSKLREKLSVVTRAWFGQRDFRDTELLQRFQENLSREPYSEDESQQYFGLSLRELVHTYKSQMLVLFKCLLLQPKMLFFGSHCETVCQVQFSLLSLIPDLVKNLRDCADRQMNRYAETLQRPDSVRTSDRASLLAYLGVPLQIFGKGSVFGPYTPLQQLDILTDLNTKSYVVGSTNSLLIQQKDRYADILIDLDEKNITILSPTLRSALAFSAADRRWIDFLVQQVNDTWNENDPSRPKTYGYAGSEEFIRLQFEEYLLALLSAEKYHQYLGSHKGDNKALLADVEGDPSLEFAHGFLECWRETQNYKLWNRTTDSHLFDIVEPRHPCAGGLTIEDVQRRLAAQVAELHLDERFSQTREVVGKRLADGRTHVTSAFNKVWADIEVMREAQRRRAEESRAAQVAFQTDEGGEKTDATNAKSHKPDLQQAQASVTAAGQRAGAYLSSWGAWAAEKRRTGWRSSSGTMQPAADVAPSGNWSQVRPVRELGQEDVTTSKATPSESSSTAHITAKTGASLENSKA